MSSTLRRKCGSRSMNRGLTHSISDGLSHGPSHSLSHRLSQGVCHSLSHSLSHSLGDREQNISLSLGHCLSHRLLIAFQVCARKMRPAHDLHGRGYMVVGEEKDLAYAGLALVLADVAVDAAAGDESLQLLLESAEPPRSCTNSNETGRNRATRRRRRLNASPDHLPNSVCHELYKSDGNECACRDRLRWFCYDMGPPHRCPLVV